MPAANDHRDYRHPENFASAHKAAREHKPLPPLPPCGRCHHSPDDHRLDDALNVSPVDPAAKFRCVIDGCDCPHYSERKVKNNDSTSGGTDG